VIVGQNVNSNENFRLFVVCEITDTIPNTILQNHHKIVFEKAVGIRESLERAWKSILSEESVEAWELKDLRLPFIFT